MFRKAYGWYIIHFWFIVAVVKVYFHFTCMLKFPLAPSSFWKGLKSPACVWQWLWHQFATFVSTSEGVKVLHKPGPAHTLYLPTHPFIGLATAAFPPVQLPAISVLFPHVARNQHHTMPLWPVGQSACSVWNAALLTWFKRGKSCGGCAKKSKGLFVWSLKIFGQWVVIFFF